ncbi:MAG: xylosidase, partial [Dysgonamonadaceae bacterium]|nr:xylosidase [Dysgonamonadaceae bacterium]
MKKLIILFGILLIHAAPVPAQAYRSYKGLIMAGYQGWFNTPSDGAGRGWGHYKGKQGFKPGSCSIDFWPDVSDYPVLYETPFSLPDRTPASTFSSHDSSTVDIHFKWMKEYGIDGVFMQRFVTEIKNPKGEAHFNQVLDFAMHASQKYHRAISIMYDLSGMAPGDENILLDDLDALEKKYRLKSGKNVPDYLYHNEKPLIAVWGIGFNDGRKYGLDESNKIIEGLRSRGYSIMIGVPTYWRALKDDAISSGKLHEIIKKCDIVLPWFVGRYNEDSYETFKRNIPQDMKWC